jgi:hypothetical protein
MTNGDNHAAIALYESCGVARVDTLVTGTARPVAERGYFPVSAATTGAKSRALSPGITWYE